MAGYWNQSGSIIKGSSASDCLVCGSCLPLMRSRVAKVWPLRRSVLEWQIQLWLYLITHLDKKRFVYKQKVGKKTGDCYNVFMFFFVTFESFIVKHLAFLLLIAKCYWINVLIDFWTSSPFENAAWHGSNTKTQIDPFRVSFFTSIVVLFLWIKYTIVSYVL